MSSTNRAAKAQSDTNRSDTNRSDTNREDILRAAIEEFGRVGYESASTNEIVKKAKVSKGLLFHHFNNKEKLYIACQLHVMEQYGKYMSEHINLASTDFFDRILHNLRVKMDFGRNHPEFLTLINRTWHMESETNAFDRKWLEEYVLDSEVGKIMLEFFSGVDTTCFREGYDVPKLLNFTRLALEASWHRFSNIHNNDSQILTREMDSYISECEEIISLLRDGAYK